jgi:hypothetical protein
LKEFLAPFARADKKESPNKESSTTTKSDSSSGSSQSNNKRQKKPYAELYTDRHFNTHIGDNEKAALVFFITSQNITAEVPHFDRILK